MTSDYLKRRLRSQDELVNGWVQNIKAFFARYRNSDFGTALQGETDV